jgi:hypothetical protein
LEKRLPEDDRLKFSQEEPSPIVAQFNPDTAEWEILVDDQWVSISHLIDSLIEVRTILSQQIENHLP